MNTTKNAHLLLVTLLAGLWAYSCAGEGGETQDGAAQADGPTTDARIEQGTPPQGDGQPATDLAALDTGNPAQYDGQPGEFTESSNGRAYRYLVPSGYTAAQAIPLLVGFHGAGDSGANFYAICKAAGFATAAAPKSFILLVPDTKSPYSDFAIWSGNPNNDVPQMKQEMDEIIAIIEEIGTHYHLDRKRIHAFGFSDDGLFTGVAGMYRSSYFASLAVCGYGWGGSYPIVTPSRKIAVQLVCGTGDSFYSMAQSSEQYLSGQGHPTQFLSASGVGHSFLGLMGAHSPSSLFQWMEQHPLP
jgi:poly(3-hydroxybutyrate) depolymerase